MLCHVLIALKNDIKYKVFDYNGHKIKILGIGKKSVKFSIDGAEPEFAYHESRKGLSIAQNVLSQMPQAIDIYPYCETHNLTANDSCDCCICDNFNYCY